MAVATISGSPSPGAALYSFSFFASMLLLMIVVVVVVSGRGMRDRLTLFASVLFVLARSKSPCGSGEEFQAIPIK
jgi:hypothetical protein